MTKQMKKIGGMQTTVSLTAATCKDASHVNIKPLFKESEKKFKKV